MRKQMSAALVAGFLLLAPAARGGLVDGLDIEFGTEIGEFHYRESHFMREDGPQYGGYLAVGLRPAPWYFQFYVSYVGGDITYDGGYGWGWWYRDLKGDTSNFIVNLRGLSGCLVVDNDLQVLLYSGLGYRYLENDLNDVAIPGVVSGYLREQTYFYLPIGGEISFPISVDGGWTLGLRGEFDWMFYGYNYSDGIKLDNQKGWGFRLTPFLRWDLDENIAFKLELFGEYWKIDDSDGNEGFMEPENASNYYGGRLGVIF
ncbi:MAG: hypothetical protein P9M08_07785 [Candidatus Erginobacter occultus]|nr:hypothetical protein [Candidatus Erginobacter occultus]